MQTSRSNQLSQYSPPAYLSAFLTSLAEAGMQISRSNQLFKYSPPGGDGVGDFQLIKQKPQPKNAGIMFPLLQSLGPENIEHGR